MPGANVIATMQSADGKPRELNQGGTATTITYFSYDGTTFIKVPITISRLSGGSGLTGYSKPVRIRAWGRMQAATVASTYTATLLFGTATTSIATIEASTGVSIPAGGAATWRVESELMFDFANNRAFGAGISVVGPTVATLATLDNGITPDWSVASNLQYYFFVAGTFGTGTATNVSYLDGFELSTED